MGDGVNAWVPEHSKGSWTELVQTVSCWMYVLGYEWMLRMLAFGLFYCVRRSKYTAGLKEHYLLGQNTTFGVLRACLSFALLCFLFSMTPTCKTRCTLCTWTVLMHFLCTWAQLKTSWFCDESFLLLVDTSFRTWTNSSLTKLQTIISYKLKSTKAFVQSQNITRTFSQNTGHENNTAQPKTGKWYSSPS